MSGPIIRSGPTEKYSSNWDQAFGKKKKKEEKASKKTTTKKKKKKKKS